MPYAPCYRPFVILKITIFFVITFFLKDAVSQTQQQLAKKLTSFNFTTLTGGTIILQARFDDFQDMLAEYHYFFATKPLLQ